MIKFEYHEAVLNGNAVMVLVVREIWAFTYHGGPYVDVYTKHVDGDTCFVPVTGRWQITDRCINVWDYSAGEGEIPFGYEIPFISKVIEYINDDRMTF